MHITQRNSRTTTYHTITRTWEPGNVLLSFSPSVLDRGSSPAPSPSTLTQYPHRAPVPSIHQTTNPSSLRLSYLTYRLVPSPVHSPVRILTYHQYPHLVPVPSITINHHQSPSLLRLSHLPSFAQFLADRLMRSGAR
jgi:hypothetical protein